MRPSPRSHSFPKKFVNGMSASTEEQTPKHKAMKRKLETEDSQKPYECHRCDFVTEDLQKLNGKHLTLTLCARRIEILTKICLYLKIHKFYPIIMKLCQNKVLKKS